MSNVVTPSAPRVSICVITFQRPEGLRRLIESIEALSYSSAAPRLELAVVDNDPSGTAVQVVEELRGTVSYPIKYAIEQRRGIPFARNTSVAMADPDADFIALIDDDEIPAPDWLDKLLAAQKQFDADVVTGPVLPEYSQEPPTWMIKGRFFEVARYKTGTVVPRAYTNNTLIQHRVFKEMPAHFDERMALTGGTDTHFFRRVHRAGYRMIWCDEAIVYDFIPASRMRLRWILQRAFRVGNSAAIIFRDICTWPTAFFQIVVLGCYRLLKGVLLLPLSWVLGRHGPAKSLQLICFGAGMLAGWFGVRYEEYKRVHGE